MSINFWQFRIQSVSQGWRTLMWNAITELDLSPINHVLDEKILRTVLARTVSLRKLDLTGCSVPDAGLSALRLVPNLTSLVLAFCEEFTMQGLVYVSTLSRLEELDCNNLGELRKTTGQLDSVVERFLGVLDAQKSTLKRLNLCGAYMQGLRCLEKFTALTTLSLYDVTLQEPIVDDPSPFLALAKLTRLDTLELSNMRRQVISNYELLELSFTLTNLKHLGIARNSSLSSDGLANMHYLNKLEVINIMGAWDMQTHTITAHLRNCTNLKTLVWTCGSANPVGDVKDVKAAFSQPVDVITRGEFMYVM
jgi:Leucine-rich repeat (LRR) protein